MNALEAYANAVTEGALDIVAAFDRDTLLRLGCNPDRVRELEHVHEAYFGPTKHTKQQKIARSKAKGKALDRLVYIENRLRFLPPAKRWEYRHQLLDVGGSFARLKAKARDIVPPADPSPPRAGIRVTRSTLGMRTLMITDTERRIADLEFRLRRGIDPAVLTPDSVQMLEEFHSIVSGEAGGVLPAAAQPLVLAPLEQHIRILQGHGDETTLRLTDGTTITGAEYLNLLGDTLNVALFHPTEGAVNLYRGQRFANEKQRTLAKAVTPACPVPGCRHGADACEIHHIKAWSQGGETNIANLVPVCRYHNRTNDDDPRRPSRGRIEVIDGIPTWHSPGRWPVPPETPGAMQLLFG